MASVLEEKTDRQDTLLKLLESKQFSSQQEVVGAMRAEGFAVTQPSISRDFQELGIVKVAGRYVAGSTMVAPSFTGNLQELISSFESVGDNLIVVKTKIGAANVLAVVLDNKLIDGLAGTIAGDDTIFIAVHNKTAQAKVSRFLKTLR